MNIEIRKLSDEDKGYALASWRESHKASPGCDKVPWAYYKSDFGALFARIINDPGTVLLGAYNEADKLVGWLAMTPSKRVNTLHWVQVKYELDGQRLRRHGVMSLLLDAASLKPRCVYTLRARRDRAPLPDGTMSKTLDESLVLALRARGITAAYVPLKEWIK